MFVYSKNMVLNLDQFLSFGISGKEIVFQYPQRTDAGFRFHTNEDAQIAYDHILKCLHENERICYVHGGS
jgi:hypothetical protein